MPGRAAGTLGRYSGDTAAIPRLGRLALVLNMRR
jgi:hypothetical protein